VKLARDIKSLSSFKRDTPRLLRQLKKTREPLILTINGEAAIVVQDVESYQELLDAKERMETIEGIRRGLESMKVGKGKRSEDFFKEFFSKHNIPEE
jgi:PHD/YefM family antitoxin component YafN of YafNO toxin-antitoxin module